MLLNNKGKEFIMSSNLNKYWLLIIAFLLVGLISGGIVLAVKQSSHKSVEISLSQRINLNRAEAWLLDALPGIGPDRAKAIVDYRNQNGSFHRTEDLLNVQGIGNTTLDTIRDLITLED